MMTKMEIRTKIEMFLVRTMPVMAMTARMINVSYNINESRIVNTARLSAGLGLGGCASPRVFMAYLQPHLPLLRRVLDATSKIAKLAAEDSAEPELLAHGESDGDQSRMRIKQGVSAPECVAPVRKLCIRVFSTLIECFRAVLCHEALQLGRHTDFVRALLAALHKDGYVSFTISLPYNY